MSITSDEDVLHGLPRIDGTRISVLHVYDMIVDGETDPAGVADALDLALGEVYEALAYYYNNPEEMRSYRAEQDAAREALRERAIESPLESGETR
jgi:uncharacterized protein (DUF433 family)